MKKIIMLALSILCLAGLAGCQQEEEPLDPQEKFVIEDVAAIEILDIQQAWAVDAPVISRSVYTNYNLAYYDVQAEFTNLSGKEMKLEDVFSCDIVFEDKKALTYMKAESEDRTELLEQYTLQPDETAYLHIYATYTPTEVNIYKDTQMVFTVDEQEYKFALTKPDDFTPEKTYAEFGETITTSENVLIEIQESFADKEIYPANGSMGYQVPADSQSFVVLKLLVSNNSEMEKSIGDIIGYRLIEPDKSYASYAGTVLLETADGTQLMQTTTMQPGEQNVLYCLMAVPETDIEGVEELRLDTADGTYYITR